MKPSYLSQAIAATLLLPSLCAHAASDAELDALKAQLAQMQKLMESLQQKVQELEARPAAAPTAPRGAPQALSQQAIAAPAQPESAYRPTVLPGSLSGNAAAAARPEGAVLDPENKGFLPIPGTSAAFRLGGYLKADAIVDVDNSGLRTQFVPTTIPTGDINERGAQTTLHAKQSRFNLELRRPSAAGDGNVRFLLENDFFGDSSSVSPTYRLRHLYAQVDNALLGQTWSTYMDTDALPDTVDFAGPGASASMRQTQLRYMQPFGDRSAFAIAVEQPETQIVHPSFACLSSDDCSIDRIPDLPFALRSDSDWGHVQWSGVIRSLGYDDGVYDDAALGWGTSLAGVIKTVGEDSVQYQLQYGDGIGRYIADLDGNNVDAIADAQGELEPVTAYAGVVAYQHYWNAQWRSTASYSLVRVGDEDLFEEAAAAGFLDPATTYRESRYASLNLIWHLYGPLNVGVEYLWGYHEQQNGEDADSQRIQLGAQINFLP